MTFELTDVTSEKISLEFVGKQFKSTKSILRCASGEWRANLLTGIGKYGKRRFRWILRSTTGIEFKSPFFNSKKMALEELNIILVMFRHLGGKKDDLTTHHSFGD